MEHYDVIIIGAGIAGCGLAYNLKRIGYKGSVLVLDKRGIGSNAGYGYRILFEDTVQKYNLPYFHRYKGFNLGAYDEIYFKISEDIYFIDYEKTCKNLLGRTSAEYKKEMAISIKDNFLKTNEKVYNFKYLIDCSGINPFFGKIKKRSKPILYWINKTKKIPNNINLEEDSFYYMFSNTGYFEEIYPIKDELIYADWLYTTVPDHDKIIPHKKTLLKKWKIKEIPKKQTKDIVPVSPTFPMVYNNCALLGDSFGNANPADGMGIKKILESSGILAFAIKKNNLKLYQKLWKRKYLEKYIKCIASKLDRYYSSDFVKKIQKYPSLPNVIKFLGGNLFLDMLKENNGSEQKIMMQIKKIFPKRQVIFFGLRYISLKIKFFLMEFNPIYN